MSVYLVCIKGSFFEIAAITSNMESADAEGRGGAPPPPTYVDGHQDAVDSALGGHALMENNNAAHHLHSRAQAHAHGGDPAHAGTAAATAAPPAHGDGGYGHPYAGAYGPPPPAQDYRGGYAAYESGGYGYGGHPPPPQHQQHGYAHYPYMYHQGGHQHRYYGPSPRSQQQQQQQQQQATPYDYDKPYPSPTNYHYQGAPFDYDIPPGSHHHQGYGPPPNAYQHAYHSHQSQSQQPPPTGRVTGASDPSASGYEYSPYYADEPQQPHDHHQQQYSMMYGPPPVPPPQYGAAHVGGSSAAAGMIGIAQVEDFRQVTPRTSDMDDGASASTANTGARSIEARGKKGTDDSSSPSTIQGTYSVGEASNSIDGAAKTPAASNAGSARGSKKDKSPEEMTAAEALITTAKQRYVYPPSGHPGPFYTQYYPHGGAPLPPADRSYNFAPPQTAVAGISQPIPTNQTLPSYRDLPSPSAVAAAVVAASKEIAAGGRSAAVASPDKASRPILSTVNGVMTTPARKRASEGEDDVVGALLEMKTSSAEKKKGQHQMQTSPSGGGGGTVEGAAASVPTIDPAEWARLLPLRLSTPNDEIHLNQLHCFIRSTLLELFVMPVGKSTDNTLQGRQYQAGEIRYHSVALAHRRPRPPHPPPPNWRPRFPIPPPHDPLPPPPPAHVMAPQAPLTPGELKTASTASGSAPPTAPTPVPPGPPAGNTSAAAAAKKMPPPSSFLRVGFRCVFCARAQREQAKRAAQDGGKIPLGFTPMSTMYPKNLAEIYNLVSRFQRIHFKECRFVPPTIRRQFNDHKESDKSRGRREYWIKSAKAIGLVDDKNGRGIRFVPPSAFEQSEATSIEKPSSNTGDGGGVGGNGGNTSRAEPSCPTTAGSGGSEAKATGEAEGEVADDTEAKSSAEC